MITKVKKAIEVLKESGYITHGMWHINDIHSRADDRGISLSKEEVYNIKDAIENRFDAQYGINWDVIDVHIDERN